MSWALWALSLAVLMTDVNTKGCTVREVLPIMAVIYGAAAALAWAGAYVHVNMQ